jgi:ParB-like chromosome segregation protein Spo0J
MVNRRQQLTYAAFCSAGTFLLSPGSLLSSFSVRRQGVQKEHVRALAEAGEALPPVLVHRATMRIIDGTHRWHAARLRGEEEIRVRFFDGDEASAFVLAVRTNIAHGLQLSLADRKAAASKIVELYPDWSNRLVASVAGLSPTTVAGIRAGRPPAAHHVSGRVGRDGRVRPLDISEGRRAAAKLIRDNPGASLRNIALQAGISPETARDVRARLRRGEDHAAFRRSPH